MPRRLLALLVLLGAFAVIACQGAPATPALSDPKEILTRTVVSLKDVKTIQVKGELSGTATIPNAGSLDLKGTTLDIATDIAAKAFRLNVSAPSFLGTTADVIVVDNAAYLKVTGPAAAMLGADPGGKYKKTDVPEASGDPGKLAEDPLKAIDEFRTALDKLPAPTKAADEKCGDQDCYHIVLKATDKDLATVSSQASAANTPFTLTIDVYSRKTDLRPARLALGLDAGAQGNGVVTFTMTYDQPVSITAPSADQIAP